jgi:hypothetical protein
MDDKDLLLYAISFLHSNIDNMVEEDFFSNMTHLPDFMEID